MTNRRTYHAAREHQAAHPGTSYQQALRALSGNATGTTQSAPSAQDPGRAYLKQIDELVGQDGAKEHLRKLAGRSALEGSRRSNLVITGQPGTGKSTIARIAGGIWSEHGEGAPQGPIVEVDRTDLVRPALGASGAATAEILESARGGTLIIDQACDLSLAGSVADPFGAEALEVIEESLNGRPGDPAVILLGYPGDIEVLFAHRPALRSLFPQSIDTEPLAAEQLWTLAQRFAAKQGSRLPDAARGEFFAIVKWAANTTVPHTGVTLIHRGGNARFVRNLVESAREAAADRLAAANMSALTDAELTTVTAPDLAAGVTEMTAWLSPAVRYPGQGRGR